MDRDIKKMLATENEQIAKLHRIVETALKDEASIVSDLLNAPEEVLTNSQRISDKVARFGGSWAFIISFFIILTLWILFNTIAPLKEDFDPYPFILMNLILSCIAAMQAPIIMMSQNREAKKDRLRSSNDYKTDLKSELILEELHNEMKKILANQNKILKYINEEKEK